MKLKYNVINLSECRPH